MNGAVGMRDTRVAHGRGATPRAGGRPAAAAGRRGRRGRRSRFASALAGLLLAGGLVGTNTGCAIGPHVLSRTEQHVIDRQFVEYPAGFEFHRYIAGLDAPTAFDFDGDQNLIIAQGGMGNFDPSIVGFRPDGKKFNVYPLYSGPPLPFGSGGFDFRGPIGGLACRGGKIYVSHRDRNGFGVITAFDYYGGHRTVVSGLPAQGEYGVTQLCFRNVNGEDRLYFGVGTATNSGVVGMDDWEIGWVSDHPEVSDKVGRDRIRTNGQRFDSPNPAAVWFGSELAVTGAFQPFNVSNQTLIRKYTDKPNGCICSVAPAGGAVKVEATGIHNPRGLASIPVGLYFTNDGMEARGTRPIMNDPDSLLLFVPESYYGWPDYTTNLHPVNEPLYQPPTAMVLPHGYRDVDLLINRDASQLPQDLSANTLVQATFPVQSGAAGLTFVPDGSPLSVSFAGYAIVALSGDHAPFATSGMKILGPGGNKMVCVNMDRKQVHEFIRNTRDLPASKIRNPVPEELERPIDVKFSPDGSKLYVLDLGRMKVSHGKADVDAGTGQIFYLSAPPPPPAAPSTAATTGEGK